MSNFRKEKASFDVNDVDIQAKETVFSGFFHMVKYRFRHRLFRGGWSDVVERELSVRGHAAALLPYDPVNDQVVLLEQIRVGALESHSPWQYEIVAGMLDEGESPEQVARREAQEEAGLEVGKLAPICCYYPSSGGCSEKLSVFVGCVDATGAGGIHGLDCEDEDIRVFTVSREQAYQWVQSGRIENGASIIALQWLMLNHAQLRQQWLEEQQ